MNVKLISIFIIFTVPCVNKTQCMLSKKLDKTKQTKTAPSSPRITNIPSAHIEQTPIIRHESPLAFPSERMGKNQEMQHIDRLNRIARENQKQIYNSDWYKKSQQELALETKIILNSMDKNYLILDKNDSASCESSSNEFFLNQHSSLQLRGVLKKH